MNVDQWTLCKVTGQHKEPFSSVIWNPRLHIYEIYAPVWEPPQPLSDFAKTLIVCAVIWSLCERPFEVLLCQSPLQCAVCIASKLLWLSLGLWALFGTSVENSLRIVLCRKRDSDCVRLRRSAPLFQGRDVFVRCRMCAKGNRVYIFSYSP